jgi:hypothetical protein
MFSSHRRAAGSNRGLSAPIASISSILRRLQVALPVSALLWALFRLLGVQVLSVFFFLATVIDFGLIVVAFTWRALTEAHPDRT